MSCPYLPAGTPENDLGDRPLDDCDTCRNDYERYEIERHEIQPAIGTYGSKQLCEEHWPLCDCGQPVVAEDLCVGCLKEAA